MIRTFIGKKSVRLLQHAIRQTEHQVRYRSHLPFNTVVLFVPQQEAWVVERFGKYNRILEPGLNVILPVVDSVKYVQSLKEIALNVPHQAAITLDNVTLTMDAVLYLRVVEPYKACYGVEDPEYAITQLAQTTMRSEIGKMYLDKVFRERESLNYNIVDAINKASEAWGVKCMRYEIRDIKLPQRVQEAMQMQVEAERKKRAAILESEGIREAEINVAEGKKQARILNSEANKTEQINQAVGEAEALVAKAKAKARSVNIVAQALSHKNGIDAVSFNVAEQYVKAFGNLAKTANTLILPANTGDVSSIVAQAMTIYKNLAGNSRLSKSDDDGGHHDDGDHQDDGGDDKVTEAGSKTSTDFTLSEFEKMEEFSSPLFDEIDKRDSEKSDAHHNIKSDDTTKKPS
ncbi:stomatin-like protein 2, mitochondrial [Gigantopelta aegis]|uniref:stomatin-like protein 2, mitochondrial n=1 Tax=Gigantopelta aegis TaxID=1735272 RepID=UPI001B8879E7|nr:stomatin-like protein 2, mitochondrial [Gigantopelta aegis]